MRFAGDKKEPVSTEDSGRSYMADHGASPTDPRARFGTGSKFGEEIDEEDREFAAKREPIGHYITRVIAEDMWDNWFEVNDLSTKGRDPDFNTVVQAALLKLNAKPLFIRATQLERIFGYSIIALAFRGEADLKAAHKTNSKARVVDAYPFRKTQISSIVFDERQTSRRYGLPLVYQINRGSGLADVGGPTLNIHYTRVLHLAPRLKIKSAWDGKSVIDIVYDDLIVLRNMRWSIGETMYRMGAGFIDVEIMGLTDRDEEKWTRAKKFTNLNTRTYFIHSEKEKIEFTGPQNVALKPKDYFDPIMESASTSTEIPVDILRGAQAGALEGSVLNDKQRWKFISKNQEMYEPYLRQLIALLMKSGQIRTKVKNYEFIWGEGFELTAKEAAHARMLNENALKVMLSYMDLEEVREESGKRGLKTPLSPEKRELILAQTQKGLKSSSSTQKNPDK